MQYAQDAYSYMAFAKPDLSMVIATRFLKAVVLMERGEATGECFRDDQEALEHLREALTLCETTEDQRGNAGESARIKWRMSQVMARLGHAEEADVFLKEAEETKKQLQATGDYPIPDNEEESWNAFVDVSYC